jgi:hypothetical protein
MFAFLIAAIGCADRKNATNYDKRDAATFLSRMSRRRVCRRVAFSPFFHEASE